MKGIRTIGVGLVVVLLMAGCSRSPDPVKVGAILPLSGPAGQHTSIADAITLAVEEINAAGGINGHPVELVIADSKTDPEEGARVFQAMEKEHRPLFYISSTSVVSLALAPLAEEAKAVLMGIAVSSLSFTPDRRWVFKYYTSSYHQAGTILFHLKRLKYRKLGLLYQDDAFGRAHEETIRKMFESDGGTVVSASFKAENPDFVSAYERLMGLEAIYIAGFVRIAGEGIRELRQMGYKGTLLTHSGSSSLLFDMPELNASLEDLCLAASIIYNSNHVFARDARMRFETRFNRPFTQQAANGFDAVRMMVGLLKGQPMSRESLRDSLEGEFSYPGILGHIEKSEGVHDIYFPLYPARVRNGMIHYLQ